MADRRAILGGGALALFALLGGACAFGREPLPDLDPAFDDRDLPADVEAWPRARRLTPSPGDDPHGHVLGGDILSPGLTGPVTDRILAFAGAR